MLTTLVVLLRLIGLFCRGHRAVALENLALRQQLAALTRTGKRPQLRTRDRLFWVWLAIAWRGWRTALSCSLTPSCGGTANGSADSGHGAQRGSVRVARGRMRRSVRS